MSNSALPIYSILPELKRTFDLTNNVVLTSPPGSGKSTVIPIELLSEPWLKGKRIVVTEPRKLAASALAHRVSQMISEPVGGTVGFCTRDEKVTSANTRLEFVTEGIIINRLLHDPELPEVGLIVFDEAHERSLNSDLALAFSIDTQSVLRPDLRLMVMSATIETELFSKLLPNCKVFVGDSPRYPVSIHYLSEHSLFDIGNKKRLVQGICRHLPSIISSTDGDILIFLPGGGEIALASRAITPICQDAQIEVCPLHSLLSLTEQQKAISPLPSGKRKIVLATSIAETSLTIEGVSCVIDCGLQRLPFFEVRSGMDRMDTVCVSKSACDQRAGRAGRTRPGKCYRMWYPENQSRIKTDYEPEILRLDLAPLALELARWGCKNASDLRFIDHPSPVKLNKANQLLSLLGVLDKRGQLTESGRIVSVLPFHPRIGAMLLHAQSLIELFPDALSVACALSVFLENPRLIKRPHSGHALDLSLAVNELLNESMRSQDFDQSFLFDRKKARREFETNLRRIKQAMQNYRLAFGAKSPGPQHKTSTPNNLDSSDLAGWLLTYAYPDRIAQRRADSPHIYLLANGRSARFVPHDPLCQHKYLCIALAEIKTRDSVAIAAADIDLETLLSQRKSIIKEEESLSWSKPQQMVLAKKDEKLGAITVRSKKLPNPSALSVAQALASAITKSDLDRILSHPDTARLLARVSLLAQVSKNDGSSTNSWPDLSLENLYETLKLWFTPHLEGLWSMKEVQSLDLEQIIRTSFLSWEQQKVLDKEAPVYFSAPSGSRKFIVYEEGQPHVSVKLQELFGLRETPRIAWGKVRIVFHLLSPAARPIQVTADLENFWQTTYPIVRKELRGRYPKHPWPEDPWQATPTARTKR